MYTTLALQFLNWASAIMNYYGVASRYCLSFARSPAVVINLWKPLKFLMLLKVCVPAVMDQGGEHLKHTSSYHGILNVGAQ